MSRITQLFAAARSLSPEVEVRFRGTAEESLWICVVTVGPVVLFESQVGTINDITDWTIHKLQSMSQRMRAILAVPEEPSDSSSGT